MKFDQLYSSSSGNLYLATAANGRRLMIECGVTWPKLQKALNYDLSGIVGCFVSHSHADHSKAVRDVMKAGIDVFASAGTFDALGIENERRAKVITNLTITSFGEVFRVKSVATNHDVAESMGFVVECDDEYLLFATDTAYITQRFELLFSIIAIECSYDREILQRCVESGDINEEVAKRLLSSHMSKNAAMTYLEKFCDLSKCREIHLLHCSGDNLDKDQAVIDFQKKDS